MTDALCHLVVDGNQVLKLKLVREVSDIENEEVTFKPDMCHQVFGENENIFGYTDLQIRLYYSAGSLLTYLGIEYTDKCWGSHLDKGVWSLLHYTAGVQIELDKFEGLKADDVEGALKKVLAPKYETNLDQFISMLETEKKFVPHGKLENAFSLTPRDGGAQRTFEVYYSETSTKGFLEYHKRMQTFLLWYVDAASFIDVDDDQWTFFTVFEKYQSSEGEPRYAVAGYATVYRYYAYPRNRRPRVSQVLVLPPYRRLGVCASLLQTIYSHFIALPEVVDITVEDPSEDFQRIRDYVDAKNCSTLPAFQPERLFEGYTAEMASQARSKFKINRRQARRVYEILRLRATNTSDKVAYQQYRLAIKNRLNAPFQKRKLEMRKLEKVLKREEYLAALSASGAEETQGRLSAEYHALEDEYRRVLHRLEMADDDV